MPRRHPKLLPLVVPGLALAVAPTGAVSAHTDSDVVAVPAGTEATVTLEPTHGCGESPTVTVRIRAPFPDARPGDVAGWTAPATPDGAGNTVLEWTGGVLPADEDGAFPVVFVAPDAPGELLTFPAIQICADGAELAWISGDPADEFPAPRVLVLAAGAAPAATIDDVPLDAPGREQLVAIVDVDNPQAAPSTPAPTTAPAPPTSTTSPAPVATTAGPTATTTTTTTTDVSAATTADTAAGSVDPATTVADADDDADDSSVAPVVVAAVVVAAVGGAVAAVVARRRRAGP